MKGSHSADEPILGLDGHTMGGFWSWAYSDLHQNTIRPVLAEYIVGVLLGAKSEGRVPWDAVDLVFEGRGIEVKSSAYVQSWSETLSKRIAFDIKQTRTYDDATQRFSEEPCRSAACYVFCLWPETDRLVSPLDATRWEFYVLSTKRIDGTLGTQKTLSLPRLRAMVDPVGHRDLREAVRRALATT